VLSGKDVIKALSKIGFVYVRTRGSHAILIKQNGKGKTMVPVPLHKELAKGTLKSIMRQSDLTREELFELV